MKTIHPLKSASFFRASSILAFLCSCSLIPGVANAADKTWIGTTNSWTSSANWSPSGKPGASDNVIFNNSGINGSGGIINLTASSQTMNNLSFNRTSDAIQLAVGSGGASDLTFDIAGSLTTGAGSKTLMLRSTGKIATGNSMQINIGGNLTLNSTLELGNAAENNAPTDNAALSSSIYGIAVGGTTTLNSGGILQLTRLLSSSGGAGGSINLGSLEMNGGTLSLTSGAAATGSVQGSEVTTTVKSLNGASGTIQGNKSAGDQTIGHLIVSGTQNGSYGGSIRDGAVSASNQVKLTKGGSSTLTLSGSNSYTGATTISGGTLHVSSTGSISDSSNVVVQAGGTFRYDSASARTGSIDLQGSGDGSRAVLTGNGTINSAITLNNLGDTLSPGNGPGAQAFGVSQTWNSFTYLWEINDFTGTTAGSDFDQIAITGGLTLSGSAYHLDITSLTALNAAGDVPNFAETNRSWSILTTTGGITGFDASNWTLLTGNFSSTPAAEGTWSLVQVGDSLVLNYQTAIPEPGTYALLGLGAGWLLIRRRRALL